MLFPKRAVDREYSFRLFTEKKLAKDFDDIVLHHEQNGKIIHRFIQTKHKKNKNKNKKIGIGELLTRRKNGAFGLIRYLIACLKIKSNREFKGEIEDFVIVTNADFDSTDSILYPVRKLKMVSSGKNKGKEISVIRIDTKDKFLDIGNGARYKFDNSVISYLQENKNFIKGKVGREVSDKEIEDCLNKLIFAVNLPNGTELSEIIKSELSKEFSNIDAKHFYSRYQEEVLILMEKEEEECLSYKQAKALFEKIREEILGAVWFGIIEPVAFFTGRNDELEDLHDALRKSSGKQAVISQVATISDLGGVGKSELARKYAYEKSEYYDGNVIWINAENFEYMKNSFLRLAKDKRVGISPKDRHGNDKTIEAIVEEIYAFFARRRRKSLFIFDNAEGYKDIKRFLHSSLHPRHKKPYVLITSRDCKWNIREEGNVEVIRLDEFGKIEALEFVRKTLNIGGNSQDKEIEELTRELQCFPLALGQAVVYIQDRNEESRLRGDKGFKISDYLKEYQCDTGKLLKKGIYENEDRYTKTVLTTWNVTMTYICKEYGFEALNVLEIMAYFAPDDIRIQEIFSKSIADDNEKLWNAVELLDRYSMIKLRERIVNIHRLVQEVTRLKLREQGREEEVLRKSLELINDKVVREDTSHIVSVWEYASKYGKLIDEFYFSSVYIHKAMFSLKNKGKNALHLLAESGSCKAIMSILMHVEKHHLDKFGEVINIKDDYGQTPLHVAAVRGKLNVVRYIVNKGANVHANSTESCLNGTPLHCSVHSGRSSIVRYLLDRGADICAEDEEGKKPLYRAAGGKSLDIVKCLVEAGSDICAKIKSGDMIPLYAAAKCGSVSIIKYFIGGGININIKNKYGNTPLHVAAGNGNFSVVRYLVRKGGSIVASNEYGETPLHRAAHNREGIEIVECLINRGAFVGAGDKNGRTPLHYSALRGSYDTTEYLIEEGAHINARDKDGNTPLHFAAEKGNVDVAEVLLKYNVDVGERLSKRDPNIINSAKTLLKYHYDINAKGKYNEAPYAVLYKSLRIVEYLFEKGVNIRNKDGNTPLHLAAITGEVDIAKILLRHNADVNAKNNEGMTALYYAAKYNHQELVELLLAHGAGFY